MKAKPTAGIRKAAILKIYAAMISRFLIETKKSASFDAISIVSPSLRINDQRIYKGNFREMAIRRHEESLAVVAFDCHDFLLLFPLRT